MRSVFKFPISCSSTNQVPYFKAVTYSNLTCLLLGGGGSLKKHAFWSGLLICHELWDIAFALFFFFWPYVGFKLIKTPKWGKYVTNINSGSVSCCKFIHKLLQWCITHLYTNQSLHFAMAGCLASFLVQMLRWFQRHFVVKCNEHNICTKDLSS